MRTCIHIHYIYMCGYLARDTHCTNERGEMTRALSQRPSASFPLSTSKIFPHTHLFTTHTHSHSHTQPSRKLTIIDNHFKN